MDSVSRGRLLELQSQRLASLLSHAIKHVPYYRNWAIKNGYSAEKYPSLDEWPVMTKAPIRNSIDDFQSEIHELGQMSAAKTSGSSGEPFKLRVHGAATDYSYACIWRSLRRYGLRPGDRRAYIWGRSYELNAKFLGVQMSRVRNTLRDWMNNSISINAYDLTDANLDNAIQRIEKCRPVYLHGYVSALYAIARRLNEENRRLKGFSLTAVITESEQLYQFQRASMEKAYDCPILEHYGSVEFGNIAQPDKSGKLRVADDAFKVETEEGGGVLVTNLKSHAFPLIRYRLGDIAVLKEPAIDDNLPYTILAGIKGRIVDLIPLKGGGHIHGVALAHVIDPHLKFVRKYKIHQSDLDHFTISLVTESDVPTFLEQQVRLDMAKLVGKSAKISIHYVDDIAPMTSGKYRWVISDVSSGDS